METDTDRFLQGDERRVTIPRTGTPFHVTLDGEAIEAFPGETVAGLLWRIGQPICRWTSKQRAPRGYFCGMGACFDCLVTVDGVRNIRACLMAVRPAARIDREQGASRSRD